MPRDATDPNLVQDLRTAVESVRHEVRAGRADTMESLRSLTVDVRDTRELVVTHIAEHKGRAEASGEHMGLVQARVSRWSALGAWARVALVAMGMVAAAVAFVVVGRQTVAEPTPVNVELLNDVRAIKTTLAELRKAGP